MANIRIKKKYVNLVGDCYGATAPFRTMAQLASFCAMYAFNKSIKVSSSKITSGQEIRDTVLDDVEYRNQIDMLAIAHTKQPEILLDDEETKNKRYKIFEDYVNAGLELLKEKKDKNLLDTNGLDTVLAILREQTKENLNEDIGSGMGRPEF
jgi:dnd system-associated protein 4